MELSAAQFELMAITAEDLRYLEGLIDDEEPDNPPAIRAVSTIMRRLFSGSGDFFKAIKLFGWKGPISVKARMLDYREPQKLWIVSAGNYVWGPDILPGMSMQFGGPNVASEEGTWRLLDDVSVELSSYLDSLAFCIFGTKVRREHIISYVANKKAAHISDSRRSPAHERLDDVWQSLYITRQHEGYSEQLNSVYLELATILHTIASSPDVRRFTSDLIKWLSTAEVSYDPADAVAVKTELQMSPVRRRPKNRQ